MNPRLHIIALSISMLLVLSPAFAQSGLDFERAWSRPVAGSIMSDSVLLAQSDEFLDMLYNMRHEQADSLHSLIEARYPEHPIGPFLGSLKIWWQILPTLSVRDTSLDEAFYRQLERVVELSENRQTSTRYPFDAMFFKTAAKGFRGRLLSDREEWLLAAQDGKSALDNVFKIAEMDTANADLLFGVGVYEYFAEAVPEKYPIVKPIMFFFPDGNRERGLFRLEQAAGHGRFASTEAAYFLVQIYTTFEPHYEQGMKYIELLRERYPDNALFQVLQGRIRYRWGQHSAAALVFKDVVSKHDAGQTGYDAPLVSQAHYYLGRIALTRDQLTEAASHFQKALFLESSYTYDSFVRALSTLYSGITFDLMNRRAEAEHAYRQAVRLKEYAKSRERARDYLAEPFQKN